MKRLLALCFTTLFLIAFPQLSFASTLDEVKEIVGENYVGNINGDIQSAQTVDELIAMLDPYSAYFTKEEFEEFMNAVDYTSIGIGVIIEKHEKGILVLQVIEGGSASQVGIVGGDIITAINGQSAAPLTVEEASSLILGPENTEVTLSILKQTGATETLTLTRKPFSIPNVTTALLYGNVGYIHLSSFSSDGAQLVVNAYNQLKNQGATSFILDLQYNGGGYVSTAEELIGMFPNAREATKIKTAFGTTIEFAIKQSVVFPVNTRLLVNGFSASASEMIAAALLDQNAAILYGQTTYGKGSMQNFFELSDGGVLKLTVGIFSGPKGTPVNKVGVKPTIQTTSDPIFKAHFDSIAATFKTYRLLPSLKDVPTTKKFTVKFNKEIQSIIDKNSIQLVALGTNETIDFSYEVTSAQLQITPKAPLQAGAEYMLIVKPTIKDTLGKTLKRGSYMHITVAAE